MCWPIHSYCQMLCRKKKIRRKRMMGLGESRGRQVQGAHTQVGQDTRPSHFQLLLGLTIVLDDALEVVCHQRPESPFVRQTQPVGKDNCSIHHCAMDKLEGGSRKETCLFSLSHRDGHSLGLTMLKQSSGQPLRLNVMLSPSSNPTSLARGSG